MPGLSKFRKIITVKWLRKLAQQAVVFVATVALLLWSALPYPLMRLIPVARATVASPVQIQKKTTANPHGARVHENFAALGINATSSAGTLTSIKVTLTDSGGSGFTPTSTLSAMTNTTMSGVSIYVDHATLGVNGEFDASDTLLSTTTPPVVQGTGPWTVTWTLQNAAVAANDAGANAGDDFFVTVSPKEDAAAVGKKFTVSIAANAADVVASNGNVWQAVSVASDPIQVVPDLVISEVKLGTSTNNDDEFIEVYNRSNVTYSATTTGLTLHIRNASGTDNARTLTFYKGIISPFGYYLIAGSGYEAAPGREADTIYDTATTTLNKLVPNGAVYLSTSATAGTNTTSPQLIDFLGWGTQPFGGYETATNTVAVAHDGRSYERKATSTDTTAAMMAAGGDAEFKGNAFDSENNANDFVVQTNPNPQNSLSPVEMPGHAADTVAPSVTSVFPSNSQTNVPIDISFIGFNFSEPMNATTINTTTVQVSLVSGGCTATYNSFPPPGEPQGKCSPVTTPLSANTAYTLTIGTGVKDLAGNALSATSTTSFTTGSGTQASTIPPFVVGSSPMTGATNVPTNIAKMVVLLNQKIASTTVSTSTIQLWQVSGTPAQQTLSSMTLDSTEKVVTGVPAAVLGANQTYEVRVMGGANGVKSVDGAVMPADPSGIGFRLNFTTGAGADLTPPKVTGTIPAASATGVQPGAVDIMFAFDDYMDPVSISTTTVTLKDANNNPIAGTVTYLPQMKEGHFIANQSLPLNATLTLTMTSGASGVRNIAATSSPAVYTQLDGNANGTGGDNYTLSFSTATSNTDTTGPAVVSATANEFEMSVTFDDYVNATTAKDFANWSLTVGGQNVTLSGNAGHSVEYDTVAKTVKFKGLRLTAGASFTVTAANMRDASGNLTASSVFSGTSSSAATMQFTGPGEGSATQTTFGGGGMSFTSAGIGFMPSAMVRPFSTFKSAATIYGLDIPIAKQIPQNGTIVITFPAGYDASSISGVKKDTFSPANADINGPSPSGTSTTTKVGFRSSGVTGDGPSDANRGGAANDGVVVDTTARTVTIHVDNPTRSESGDVHDFLHFDIAGIVNPSVPKDTSTGGYILDIKTKDASGNLLETITPGALYIIGGGDFTLRGKIYPSWSSAAASTAGLNGVTVYLDAPMIGRISTTTTSKAFGDAATDGRFEFTGLASSTYVMLSTDALLNPTGTTTAYIGQMPQSINLDSVLNPSQCTGTTCTQNFSLTATNASGVATVAIKLSHAANTFGSTEKIDIFAGGPGGFTSTTTAPGTASRDGTATYVTMPVLQNGDWYVGLGPEMPKGSQMFMGPPPMPEWIMPAPQRVTVTGCPSACVANPAIITFSVSKTNRQIVGTVQDGSGNGIANAMVFAYKPFNTTGTAGATTMEAGFGTHAQSDTTGKFILKVVDGSYIVGAFAPGFPPSIEMPVTVNASGVFANGSNTATTNVLVKLVKPPYKIPGKVVDSSNNPISNASVFAYRTDGPGHAESPSDSSGNFTLWVNNGTWNVEAFLPQYGHLTAKTGLIISNADASALTITPGSLNTITGRVWKDNDGNATYDAGTDTPVANAQLRAFGPNGFNNTWSDTNGQYTLRVQAGVYTVGGFVPEFGELAPKTNVNASAGNLSGQNFIVKPPARVTINIKDTSDNAVTVNRAFVDLFNTTSQFGNHAEITNGTTTSVFVPADTVSGTVYKVFAYVEGMPPSAVTMQSDSGSTVIATSTQTVTVNGAEAIKIVLSSTVYSVSGTVYKTAATSGNELGDAWVEVVDDTTGVHFGAMTSSSGAYSLKLAPGTYTMQAMRPGTLPSPTQLVVSNAGAVTLGGASVAGTAVQLVLTEGTIKISGTITVGGSVPSNIQAFVRGEKKGGGYAGAKVNADGTYDLFVAAGEWRVFAMVEGYQEKEVSAVVVISSSSASGVNIDVSATATVSLKKSTTVAVDSTANAIIIDEASSSGSSMKITFPEKSISSTDQPATIEIKETNKVSKTSAGTPMENRGKEVTIKAGSGSSATKVSSLNSPATVEITYQKATLVADGVDTKTGADKLKLARWSDSALEWTALPTTVIYKDSDGAIVTPTDSLSNVASVLYKGTTQSFSPGGTINPSVGDATAPSTPQGGPSVTPGNGQVALSWSYSDNNGQTVSYYNIYRETSASGAFNQVRASTTAKSYTDTTVVNGTTYYYKFAAVDNDQDESDNSPVSDAATPQSTFGAGSGGGGGGATPAASPTPTPAAAPTPPPAVSPAPTPAPPGMPKVPEGAKAIPLTLADGTLIRAEGDPRVYVVRHGVKQWIKSAAEFVRRGLKWENVKVVPVSDVAQAPEALLVRVKGDPKVYVVKDNIKRWIRSAALFVSSGYNWAEVKEVAPSELASYRGSALVRVAGDPKVYVIVGGARQHVATPESFTRRGYKWDDVQEVTAAERDVYPESTPLR